MWHTLELVTPNMIGWCRFGADTISMRLKERVQLELEDVQDNPSMISVTSSPLIFVSFGIEDDECNGNEKTISLSLLYPSFAGNCRLGEPLNRRHGFQSQP